MKLNLLLNLTPSYLLEMREGEKQISTNLAENCPE